MNVNLLYKDRDWEKEEPYYDGAAMIQDLGLHILFRMASRQVIYEKGEVKQITETDPFLQETMKKVMLVPLQTEEEILYRQEILKDCLNNKEAILELYQIVSRILTRWDSLGRRERKKAGSRDVLNELVTEIQVFYLFLQGVSEIREQLRQYQSSFRSRGLKDLSERLEQEFSEDYEKNLKKLAEDISFFISPPVDTERPTMRLPRISLNCRAGEGGKLTGFTLVSVGTEVKKYRDPNSTISKMQDFFASRTPDAINFPKESALRDQASALEYQVVRYLMGACQPFLQKFAGFFDQLKLQIAFYVGAVNLRQHMDRFELESCFPTVCQRDNLDFEELKEFVMCMEQRVKAVGNTCQIKDRNLLVVTGANQGGKSTFLRSIGIAQVMFQCGLQVTARQYASGIFPALFTHFTRREDSSMNSGRLDEELGRMNQIIEHLGEHSLLLLNESFATTTEKEGSVIAYDIITALQEAGVKILTVTHLLSFANKVYEEAIGGTREGVAFLSAERREDGRRTFRMIEHAPELTSFGLDLYDSIIPPMKTEL